MIHMGSKKALFALLSSKLLQHKTDRHYMLLGDRNNLATGIDKNKASHKAKPRHRRRKHPLSLYRRLPLLLQLIVLPSLVQLVRNHNPLPSPHG
ncbi:hypothetical protein AZE42_11409, partial [Rhizopogon vesiculosus]